MDTRWLFLASLTGLLCVVAYGTLRSGQILRVWTPPFNLLLNPTDNLMRLAMIGICLGLGAWLGPGPQALGWHTERMAQDLGIGALVGLVLSGALAVVGQVVARRWGPEVYSLKMLQCMLPLNKREWVSVLAALLPSALLEELLFRSLPLGGLAWLISPGVLLWPLAVGFGLLHEAQGSWGIVGTTFAGLVFAGLFLATGSVWAPFSAHYVANVTQIIVARRLGVSPLRGRTPVQRNEDQL